MLLIHAFKERPESSKLFPIFEECKTAKKAAKSPAKAVESAVATDAQDETSPKSGGKKSTESSPKSGGKGGAGKSAQKRNDSKERDLKAAKRSLSKEPEEVKIKIEPHDNSYELTIEEVIASSMLIEQEFKVEGEESASEGELKGKRRNPAGKKGLRNGKLRQTLPKTETGI